MPTPLLGVAGGEGVAAVGLVIAKNERNQCTDIAHTELDFEEVSSTMISRYLSLTPHLECPRK